MRPGQHCLRCLNQLEQEPGAKIRAIAAGAAPNSANYILQVCFFFCDSRGITVLLLSTEKF